MFEVVRRHAGTPLLTKRYFGGRPKGVTVMVLVADNSIPPVVSVHRDAP
jgi:hypothetical protein